MGGVRFLPREPFCDTYASVGSQVQSRTLFYPSETRGVHSINISLLLWVVHGSPECRDPLRGAGGGVLSVSDFQDKLVFLPPPQQENILPKELLRRKDDETFSTFPLSTFRTQTPLVRVVDPVSGDIPGSGPRRGRLPLGVDHSCRVPGVTPRDLTPTLSHTSQLRAPRVRPETLCSRKQSLSWRVTSGASLSYRPTP